MKMVLSAIGLLLSVNSIVVPAFAHETQCSTQSANVSVSFQGSKVLIEANSISAEFDCAPLFIEQPSLLKCSPASGSDASIPVVILQRIDRNRFTFSIEGRNQAIELTCSEN